MSEQQYDIIFRGDIVLGQQLIEVKLRLQQLFKADAAKVETLFSGRPVPLKRNLNLESAQKYRDALIQAGAQVELVASGDVKPVVPASPKPLAAVLRAEVTATDSQQAQTGESWSLAPVGAYLLQPAEQTPFVQNDIDTSSLSLRPEGSNLLDVSEQPKVIAANVIAPDLKLAEVGADLVRAEEKLALPVVEIDVGDWDIAELGADMISATEKEILPLPVIQVLDVGLAPVGSDLGQIKERVAPVTPDISGLSLAE